ncbi:YfbU family protein [Streptomyces sp. NPDC002130]|uniref:YfbU family protein n=1 Tax=Streptomyces sp. NPDC002130 TaxID=3155568 RepID=UPI00332A39C2
MPDPPLPPAPRVPKRAGARQRRRDRRVLLGPRLHSHRTIRVTANLKPRQLLQRWLEPAPSFLDYFSTVVNNWYQVAGFNTELPKHDCGRVSDILEMFRIITYGIDHHSKNRTPVEDKLAFELEFQGFNHNDPQENHMASYVDFLLESWLHLRAGEERLRAESVVDALGKYPRPITLSNFVAFDVVGC